MERTRLSRAADSRLYAFKTAGLVEPSYTGTKRMAWVVANSMKETKTSYVICVRAEESTDIEVRKVYEVLPDETAAKRGHLRVIDESGEDYLLSERMLRASPSSGRGDSRIHVTAEAAR